MRSLALFLLLALAARPASSLSDASYCDRVRGAWLGKCIGGALGMPIEGWHYSKIDQRYPRITGYLGYFTGRWQGWSGILATARLPRDGQWHRLSLSAPMPDVPAGCYPIPILGMSFERSTAPGAWEIRDVRMAGRAVPCNDTTWEPANSAWWTEPGTLRLDFTGERAWVKMVPETAKGLGLRTLSVTLEARWLSGADEIGLALDYRTLDSSGFGPDDDTTYQVVALHALEVHGPDLAAADLAAEWLEHLPAVSPALAEGLALQRMRQGIMPPESGRHPIGEAIGGQMKAEIWGLVCPGRPDLAAEYARRDGVVAHCDNGVYGEQFVAAMVAAAFTTSDIRTLIRTGLAQIPPSSKYASVVREVLALHACYRDWRKAREVLIARYPRVCDPVYAEEGIVLLALLYGGGDFTRSVTIAASCGSDTDCNAATVGALLGCIQGAHALPAQWTRPVGDDFRCFARGLEQWRISDLARRTCAQGRRVEAWHGQGTRFTRPL